MSTLVNLGKGQKITTLPLIFKSYDLGANSAIMALESNGGMYGGISLVEYVLPLNLPEFGLGFFGYESYQHPTDLPISNSNFCIWKNKKEHTVTHNLTGEVCYLNMSNFHLTGEFTLIPFSRWEDKRLCQSILHTRNSVRLILEDLKGSEIQFSFNVQGILYKNILRPSILLSKTAFYSGFKILVESVEYPVLSVISSSVINNQF